MLFCSKSLAVSVLSSVKFHSIEGKKEVLSSLSASNDRSVISKVSLGRNELRLSLEASRISTRLLFAIENEGEQSNVRIDSSKASVAGKLALRLRAVVLLLMMVNALIIVTRLSLKYRASALSGRSLRVHPP